MSAGVGSGLGSWKLPLELPASDLCCLYTASMGRGASGKSRGDRSFLAQCKEPDEYPD